jgi:hypothetical protein
MNDQPGSLAGCLLVAMTARFPVSEGASLPAAAHVQTAALELHTPDP